MTQLTDDPIAALERELVQAAERQAAAAPPPSPSPPQRWTRHLSLPATIAAVLLPVLLVAGVLFLTRSASPGRRSNTAAAHHAQSPTLIGQLAILRRPQYPSDRVDQPSAEVLHSIEVERAAPGASMIPSLERHVVVRVPGEHPLSINVTVLGGRADPRGQQVLISGIAFIGGRAWSYLQAPVNARALATGGEITALGDRYIAALLPDGVAALRSHGAGETVTAAVHDNVSGMRLPRGARTLLWLNRRGAVIRRLPLITPAPRAPTANGSRPAPADSLRGILGVLRRPRTAADTLPRSLVPLSGAGQLATEAAQGVPQLRHARCATTAPWGVLVYLVPYAPLAASAATHLTPTQKAEWKRSLTQGPTLGILTTQGGSTGTPLAAILAGQAMDTSTGSDGTQRVLQAVPDRVAWVVFDVRAPRSYTGPRHPLVAVSHNVAAVELINAGKATVTGSTWLDARHRIIARHPLP